MWKQFSGLDRSQVSNQKSLGNVNYQQNQHVTTYRQILIRNIFSLINVILTPLITTLVLYGLYVDALAFAVFLIINTITSILDEIRTKKQLDKLKTQFQATAQVIRENQLVEIPVAEIVLGDLVYATEGDSIIADGKILDSRYLQLDESMLTGESDYLQKETGDKLFAGGFVVTGQCVYEVIAVGKNNYLNQLSSAAFGKKTRSRLQINGDRVILFLVIAAISVGGLNFVTSTLGGATPEARLLSLTTIISLIIPQTLIFLFTLTFTVSSVKLYRRGVLVQKTGSIPELSDIDVVCFDKTGTLTTNVMFLREVAYFNTSAEEMGQIYKSVKNEIVGVNRTQQLLSEYFDNQNQVEVSEIVQVPFNSKQKFSLIAAKQQNEYKQLVFGAVSVLKEYLDKTKLEEVLTYITKQEEQGNRVLVALFSVLDKKQDPLQINYTDKCAVFSIEEELNLGVQSLLSQLAEQGIAIKIISGDSKTSVARIAQKVGFNADSIVDLSEISKENLEDLAKEKTIFTRARPEDKASLVKALRAQGLRVAMVGDGINDVLGMKAANVSIAMESGAKITREVSDFVLLSNDYKRIPTIFYEGDNIIFNLKLSTKMFIAKAVGGIFLGLFFSLISTPIPILPASTLIFSFLGTSAPGYVLVFSRQRVKNKRSFFRDVLSTGVPAAFIITSALIFAYLNLREYISPVALNTTLVLISLSTAVAYSLYLVFVAKKLNSLIIAALAFLLVNAVGIFQTILPLWQYNTEARIFLLSCICIAVITILSLIYRQINNMRKSIKLPLFTLVGIAAITIISLFPFQAYYQVTNLPLNNILGVLSLGIIILPLFYLVDLIVGKIISLNK